MVKKSSKSTSSEKDGNLLLKIYDSVRQSLSEAAEGFRNKPSLMLISIIGDVAFLLVFGILNNLLGALVLLNVMKASNKITAISSSLQDAPASLTDLIDKSVAWPEVKSALLWLALFLLLLYILFVLAQGIAWKACGDAARTRKTLRKFLKRFALTVIPWFALFVIYNAVITLLDFLKLLPEQGSRLSLLAFFLIPAHYFIAVSMAEEPRTNAWLGIAIGFLLFLPWLALGRASMLSASASKTKEIDTDER